MRSKSYKITAGQRPIKSKVGDCKKGERPVGSPQFGKKALNLAIKDTFSNNLFSRRVVAVRDYWFHENVYYSSPGQTGTGIWVYDVALIKLDEMLDTFTPVSYTHLTLPTKA